MSCINHLRLLCVAIAVSVLSARAAMHADAPGHSFALLHLLQAGTAGGGVGMCQPGRLLFVTDV
jgi:hypothetical protein